MIHPKDNITAARYSSTRSNINSKVYNFVPKYKGRLYYIRMDKRCL